MFNVNDNEQWRLLKELCDQFSKLEDGDFDELLVNEFEKIIKLKEDVGRMKELVESLSTRLDDLAEINVREKKPAKTGFPSEPIYVSIGRRLVEFWREKLNSQRIEDLNEQRQRRDLIKG